MIQSAPQFSRNDSRRAGQLASRKNTFGEHSRYAVAAVHTRGDAVEWFVWDAEKVDPILDLPAVVRQAASFAEAVADLD